MRNISSVLTASEREDGYSVAVAMTPYEHMLCLLALRVARKERDIDPISMEAMVVSGDMAEALERM